MGKPPRKEKRDSNENSPRDPSDFSQRFEMLLEQMRPYDMELKKKGKDLEGTQLKLAKPEKGLPTSVEEARKFIDKTDDCVWLVAPDIEHNAIGYFNKAAAELLGIEHKTPNNMIGLSERIGNFYFPKDNDSYAPRREYILQKRMLGMLAKGGFYQLPMHKQIVDKPGQFLSVEAVAKHLFSEEQVFIGTLLFAYPEIISEKAYNERKAAKQLNYPTPQEIMQWAEERNAAQFALMLKHLRPYDMELKKSGQDLENVRLKLAYPKKGLPTSLEEMSERINDKKTKDMLQFYAPETRHNKMEEISEAAKKFYGFQPFPDGKNAENVALLVANTYVPKDTKIYAPQQEFSQQQTMLRLLAEGGLYQLPSLLLILDQEAQKSRSGRAKWSDLHGSQYLAVRSQPDHLFSKDGEFLGTLISLRASDISEEEYNNAKTARQLITPTPQEIYNLVMERHSEGIKPQPHPQPKPLPESRQEAIIHVTKPENAEKIIYVVAPSEEHNHVIAGSFAFWSFCQKIGLSDFIPGSPIARLADYLAEKFLPEDSQDYNPRQAFLQQQQMFGHLAKDGKYALPDAIIALNLGTEFMTLKFQSDHIFLPSGRYECTLSCVKATPINERKYKQLYQTQKLVIPTPEDTLAMFQKYLDDQ